MSWHDPALRNVTVVPHSSTGVVQVAPGWTVAVFEDAAVVAGRGFVVVVGHVLVVSIVHCRLNLGAVEDPGLALHTGFGDRHCASVDRTPRRVSGPTRRC